jgi:hypothetical protein
MEAALRVRSLETSNAQDGTLAEAIEYIALSKQSNAHHDL